MPGASWCHRLTPVASSNNATTAAVSTTALAQCGDLPRELEERPNTGPELSMMGVDAVNSFGVASWPVPQG